MAVFKPSNSSPQLEEIDLNDENTFSCTVNTSSEPIKAYKLSILNSRGDETIYEPDYPTALSTPLLNKGVLNIEGIQKELPNTVPKGTEYFTETTLTTSEGFLTEPKSFTYVPGYTYALIKIDDEDKYIKMPAYAGKTFKNENDYQWGVRTYNVPALSTALPNTQICDGFITGSTKTVVWMLLANHGEGQTNKEIADQIIYDRYIQFTANSANDIVLGAKDDEDKTKPSTYPYTERKKIDWVTKELGKNKDMIKIETEEALEYNYIDGTSFSIYQCSDQHTVKSVFADPNSNVNVSLYIQIYEKLVDNVPTNLIYKYRKITGYSSDTGEIRVVDNFAKAPTNGMVYKIYTKTTTSGTTTYTEVTPKDDNYSTQVLGGQPITNTNFITKSNVWNSNTKRLFIQPNINIKTDYTNPNEIVFNNGCRIDINKQMEANATTGKLLDVTFNKLDDTQWLLTGNAITYGSTIEIPRESGTNHIQPLTDYTIYSDFADSMPYNVFYARTAPTSMVIQMKNAYNTDDDFQNINSISINGKSYYKTLEGMLRGGEIISSSFFGNKQPGVNRVSFKNITQGNYTIAFSWTYWKTYIEANPVDAIISYSYDGSKWIDSQSQEVVLSEKGIILTISSGTLSSGDSIDIQVKNRDVLPQIEIPSSREGSYTVSVTDYSKLLLWPSINCVLGTYEFTYLSNSWKYNGSSITLSDIGLEVTQKSGRTPLDYDAFTVEVVNSSTNVLTPSWISSEELTETLSAAKFKEKVVSLYPTGGQVTLTCYNDSGTLNWKVSTVTGTLSDFGLLITGADLLKAGDVITVGQPTGVLDEDYSYTSYSVTYSGILPERRGTKISYLMVKQNGLNLYIDNSGSNQIVYDYRDVTFNTELSYNVSTHPLIKYYYYSLYDTNGTLIETSEETYSSLIQWTYRGLATGENNVPNVYAIKINIVDEFGKTFSTSLQFGIFYDTSESIVPLILDYDCHEKAISLSIRDPLTVITTDLNELETVTSDDLVNLSDDDETDDYLKIGENQILNYDSISKDEEEEKIPISFPENMTVLTQFLITKEFIENMSPGTEAPFLRFRHDFASVKSSKYIETVSGKEQEVACTIDIDRSVFSKATGELEGIFNFRYYKGSWYADTAKYRVLKLNTDPNDDMYTVKISSAKGETDDIPGIDVDDTTMTFSTGVGAVIQLQTLKLGGEASKLNLSTLGITITFQDTTRGFHDNDLIEIEMLQSGEFVATFSYPAPYYFDGTNIVNFSKPGSIKIYPITDEFGTSDSMSLEQFTSLLNTNIKGGIVSPIDCFESSISGVKQDYYSIPDNCGEEYLFKSSLKFALQESTKYTIVKTAAEFATIYDLPADQKLNKNYVLTFDEIYSRDSYLFTKGIWIYNGATWNMDIDSDFLYIDNLDQIPSGETIVYPSNTVENGYFKYVDDGNVWIDSGSYISTIEAYDNLWLVLYCVLTSSSSGSTDNVECFMRYSKNQKYGG